MERSIRIRSQDAVRAPICAGLEKDLPCGPGVVSSRAGYTSARSWPSVSISVSRRPVTIPRLPRRMCSSLPQTPPRLIHTGRRCASKGGLSAVQKYVRISPPLPAFLDAIPPADDRGDASRLCRDWGRRLENIQRSGQMVRPRSLTAVYSGANTSVATEFVCSSPASLPML